MNKFIFFVLTTIIINVNVNCLTPFKNPNNYNNKLQSSSQQQQPSFVSSCGSSALLSVPPKQNPFDIIFEWNQIEFEYETLYERQRAIDAGNFIPANNLPLGIELSNDRIFITLPRWKNGVPASLAWLPLPMAFTYPHNADTAAAAAATEFRADENDSQFNYVKNPPMKPYPNINYHLDLNAVSTSSSSSSSSSAAAAANDAIDCSKLVSVYRLFIDSECNRLWIIDAGVVNATIKINQICPPKIVVFNLLDNKPLFIYNLPELQVKQDSLHSNIIVDVRDGRCSDAHAYVTDVWRYGLIVFSLAKKRSWRTVNHLYQPNPIACNYNLNNINFQWTDGIFGITLSDLNKYNDRILYFHPMSSYAEFMVSTSVLRNETIWTEESDPGQLATIANAFVWIGERGANGQSSTSGIDRNHKIMFYNLVQKNGVGCWNTKRSYTANNVCIIAQNNETLSFPNDLKLDNNPYDQAIWVLSNRLPTYLYSKLNENDINFRIHRASVSSAISGNCCADGLFTK